MKLPLSLLLTALVVLLAPNSCLASSFGGANAQLYSHPLLQGFNPSNQPQAGFGVQNYGSPYPSQDQLYPQQAQWLQQPPTNSQQQQLFQSTLYNPYADRYINDQYSPLFNPTSNQQSSYAQVTPPSDTSYLQQQQQLQQQSSYTSLPNPSQQLYISPINNNYLLQQALAANNTNLNNTGGIDLTNYNSYVGGNYVESTSVGSISYAANNPSLLNSGFGVQTNNPSYYNLLGGYTANDGGFGRLYRHASDVLNIATPLSLAESTGNPYSSASERREVFASVSSIECPTKPSDYTCPQVLNLNKDQLKAKICEYETVLTGTLNLVPDTDKAQTRCGAFRIAKQDNKNTDEAIKIQDQLAVIVGKDCQLKSLLDASSKGQQEVYMLIKSSVPSGTKLAVIDGINMDLLSSQSGVTKEDVAGLLKQCSKSSSKCH